MRLDKSVKALLARVDTLHTPNFASGQQRTPATKATIGFSPPQRRQRQALGPSPRTVVNAPSDELLMASQWVLINMNSGINVLIP